METFVAGLSVWSYFAVFAIMALEGAGAPVPGHSVYLASVVIAAQPGSSLSLPLLILACIGGSALGGPLGYVLGSRFAQSPFVLSAATHPFFASHRVRYGQARTIMVAQSGKTILLARYMPVLCFAAGPLAGVIALNFGRYALLNLLGAMLWTTTHTALGYFLGSSLGLLSQVTGGIGVLTIGVIALFAFVTWRRLRGRSQERTADDSI